MDFCWAVSRGSGAGVSDMMSNGEKHAYALDASITRGWEIVVNGIQIEALLNAYAAQAQQQEESHVLEWLTATNRKVGITYTYGMHPNALPGQPYDGIWKREYTGGGSVIAVYAEEPVTHRIYVGVLWQRRTLHHPTMPVLAVPRGYTQPPEDVDLFTRFPKDVGEHLHRQTALTELNEEMVVGSLTVEMLEQLGPPTTTNNADVDTSGEGEGVYFYRMKLPWSSFEIEGPEMLRLKAGLSATQGILEGIVRCQFVPIQHVLELLDDPDNQAAGCCFTEIAIGRLTRFLHREGYPIFEEKERKT
ncbi:MAG: hypothetical protein NVS4B1_10730 [Ktedonobacteraceae bacterium]